MNMFDHVLRAATDPNHKDADAMYSAANYFLTGALGAPKSEITAREFFEKAANYGNEDAKKWLKDNPTVGVKK